MEGFKLWPTITTFWRQIQTASQTELLNWKHYAVAEIYLTIPEAWKGGMQCSGKASSTCALASILVSFTSYFHCLAAPFHGQLPALVRILCHYLGTFSAAVQQAACTWCVLCKYAHCLDSCWSQLPLISPGSCEGRTILTRLWKFHSQSVLLSPKNMGQHSCMPTVL